MSADPSAPASPPAPKERLSAGDWALILLLAAVNFTHILDFVILMPMGKQLMTDLKITPEQFSTLIAVYAYAAVIVGLLGAVVADRFDRKHLLLFAYGGFTVATLFCGIADSYETFLIARGFAGGLGGLSASVILAIIADAFPVNKRGLAFGAVTSAFAFAAVVGIPLGLELAYSFDTGAPFLFLGFLSIAVWLVALLWMRSVDGHLSGERGGELKALLAVATTPTHVRSFLFMFFLVVGTFMVVPFIAPYMQFNGGLSERAVMIAYSIAGLSTLIGMNVVGLLTDKFGARRVFVIVATGSIAMTLLITHLTPTTVTQGTLLAIGFMLLATGRIVPAQAMMMAAARPAVRGRFSNLNNAVSHLGTGLSAQLAGMMMTGGGESKTPLVGYPLVGEVAACLAVVAIGLSFALKPAEQPTAVMEPTGEPPGFTSPA